MSLAERLQYNSLPALPVELRIVDLLPGAEVQLASGDRYDDLMVDEQALQVSVSV